jgi:hypothetical protein
MPRAPPEDRMASTTPSFGRRTAAPPALKLVSAPRVVVGGLALALLLVGPSGAIRLLTDDASPEVATAELRLGAASLRVPSSWVAAPLTRDAVRLAMPWPELGEARSAVASPDRVLIVELRAAAGDDPAERARERHARFVTAETSSEHGLVRRGA